MHVKDLHPISLDPLLFSCHEDILWGTTVLCPPPSATQMPTSHQSTRLSLSKEPHLTQNRLLSEKQMSLLMKGMKIGAIMSYCVINEYKLHCQCYLQFHMAQSPVIMSMQLFRSEDFSVRDSRHGQNTFGSFCGARKLEPALEGFITAYLEANLWAKALKMGLDLKKKGGSKFGDLISGHGQYGHEVKILSWFPNIHMVVSAEAKSWTSPTSTCFCHLWKSLQR